MDNEFTLKHKPKRKQDVRLTSETAPAELERGSFEIEVYRCHLVFGRGLTPSDRQLAKGLVNLRIAYAQATRDKDN